VDEKLKSHSILFTSLATCSIVLALFTNCSRSERERECN